MNASARRRYLYSGLSRRNTGATLFADHQGSIIGMADGNGAVFSAFPARTRARRGINRYDGVARRRPCRHWGVPPKAQSASNVGRFQFTGQAWLPDLGMYLPRRHAGGKGDAKHKARIYSPTLGRRGRTHPPDAFAAAPLLQTDPIGYQDQFNLYEYVGNDPVNARDPSGEAGCSDAGSGAQVGLTGRCLQSQNFTADKDGASTAVGTAEIDASASENLPSIENDAGENENIAQFDQSEEGVEFTSLSTKTTDTNTRVTEGRAEMIGNPDAAGHSQLDLSDGSSNIAPGYQNSRLGDHLVVNAGRPNYIINSGMIVVLERSGGQFRVRIVVGEPSAGELRQIQRALNQMQLGSR